MESITAITLLFSNFEDSHKIAFQFCDTFALRNQQSVRVERLVHIFQANKFLGLAIHDVPNVFEHKYAQLFVAREHMDALLEYLAIKIGEHGPQIHSEYIFDARVTSIVAYCECRRFITILFCFLKSKINCNQMILTNDEITCFQLGFAILQVDKCRKPINE